jgi:type I restriction enzyme S subunit
MGNVPAHWGVMRSRRLFTLRKESARPGDRQLTASQKYGMMFQDDFMAREGQRVVQVIKGADILKHVEPNDFVISMRSFQGGIEWCKARGSTSSAYVILTPNRQVEGAFFSYLFKSSLYIQALRTTTDLVRDGQALRFENFAKVDLPAIPREEQAAIALFLDRETAKIDALVAEQQRLMELLREKRQAVISNAVTKGLNPDAPMKDSGVEWLGDVPAHWDIRRVKFLASIRTGIAKGKDFGSTEIVDVPYLRVANVQDGYLDLSDVHVMPVPTADLERFRLRAGDVLMNEGGDFDKLGRGAVWKEEIDPCVTQNHVFAVRLRELNPDWLATYSCGKAAQFYFKSRSKQSTNLASISSTNIMELPVPLPPNGEREEILQFVRDQTSSLDALNEDVRRAVDLLMARRAAVISAAVTGQIDVRQVATHAAA